MAVSAHPFLPGAELSAPMSMGSVDVNLEEPEFAAGLGITVLPDGSIQVELGDGVSAESAEPSEEFDANLAETISDTDLAQIAQDVIEMVDIDMAARQPWYQRLAKGLELLGLIDDNSAPPFEGASAATHPLLAEAVVQFQSRAIAELVPPGGPAKSKVVGESNQEREAQAERVADYLNYQTMISDRVYFPQMDQLLFLLGCEGSEFKKVYTDPVTGKNVARLVRAEDFVVPYGATTLEDASRYTHVLEYSANDFRRCVKAGLYRDVPVTEPSLGPSDGGATALQDAKDDASGQVHVDLRPQDRPHTVYEMAVDLVLPGSTDGDGDIALPYVVSVERDTPVVLAIRRNWREADDTKTKRIRFVHYPFIRGPGFYGLGFVHLLGGLGKAATGLLRLMIDNGAFAGLQGGFKSKDAKIARDTTLTPGKWADTDMTAEELHKAFYTPPYKDVPQSLFALLGAIVESGQRFATTTESMVGDAKNTGPVGTTVALIEQGSKVFSAIHKRLHYAQGEELRLLAELNGETLPAEGYPYDVHGASKMIMASDFDDRVDVVPVSDPNIFSSTQRIALAQSTLQLAMQSPDLYDRRAANRRVLEALRVPNWEELMPERSEIPRYDALTENMLVVAGRPVRAFIDQDHDAHIVVMQSMLESLAAQKRLAPPTQAAAMAHITEHLAMKVMVDLSARMGIPPLPVNLDAKPGEPVSPQMPPQLEHMITGRAAQAVAQQKQQQAEAAKGQQIMAAAQEVQKQRAKEERETVLDAREKELELQGKAMARGEAAAQNGMAASPDSMQQMLAAIGQKLTELSAADVEISKQIGKVAELVHAGATQQKQGV